MVEAEFGEPLSGLHVRAYDKDWIFDDKLGETVADASGKFEIAYIEAQYRDLHETQPDIYVRVFAADGKTLLYSSESAVRQEAMVAEHFEIQIPRAKLPG